MTDHWRALVERLLPWYQPIVERQRDAHTARVIRRSEVARLRAARVLEEYRRADDVANQRGRGPGEVEGP